MPFLSEDAQVNPQHIGTEPAWWLTQELATKGVETSYPNSEGWGWFLKYTPDDNDYRLCCPTIVEDGGTWRVYLDLKAKSLYGRNKASLEGTSPLLIASSDVLFETDAISDIVWSSKFPS